MGEIKKAVISAITMLVFFGLYYFHILDTTIKLVGAFGVVVLIGYVVWKN